MPSRPITEAEVARIRELHARGMGRNDIATEVGRSPGSITTVANRLGLSFDRSKTEAATAAKQADNRARRAAIVARLYGQAEKNLSRLDRERHKMVEVSLGKVVRYEVEDLPGADVHRLMGAVGSAMSTAARLEQVDGDGSAEQMGSLLGSMLDTLAARHAAPAGDA